MLIEDFVVDSPNVVYSEDNIRSTYIYESTSLQPGPDGSWVVRPTSSTYEFEVDRRVPKLG
jgi:myo-inositol-1-phosphate synthase